MKKFSEHIDLPTFIIGIATLALFIFALFTKKILHDILLETAVFLISFKIILGIYKQSVMTKILEEKLEKIQNSLDSLENSQKR